MPSDTSFVDVTSADEPLLETFEMVGDLPGGFRLGRPVRVQTWLEHGEYVAEVPDLNVSAFGATRDEALDNARARIVEQRRKLQGLGERLSPRMRDMARRLEAIVLPRHA